jgi:hypothetical protein
MESRIKSPANDWIMFFSAILNTPVSELNMELEVKNGKIKIKTKNKDTVAKLTKVLNNPESIRGNLAYTISTKTPAVTTTEIKEITYPDTINIIRGDGIALFERLIGKDRLKQYGCPAWIGEVVAESSDPDFKVLLATDLTASEAFFQSQLNVLREIIRNATYADFRNAFAISPNEYHPLPMDRTKKGIIGEYIDKVLFKKDDTVYFDYGFLTKCLIAPLVRIKKRLVEDESRFEINEAHLISYLGTLINENYILHVTGDKDDAKQQARPIVFNMGEAHEVNFRFSFLLDCSGSMEGGFTALIKYIRDFIEDISKLDKFKDSIIRITPFATDVMPTREFLVKDLAKSMANLELYFSLQGAGGETDLDNAVCTKLKEIENSSPLTDDIIFIWTDGQDSTKGKHTATLNAFSETLRQKSNPPKIFAIGFGAKCDEAKLTKLALFTGTNYIKLNRVEDLDQIHEYLQLDVISNPRRLVHFIQKMHPVTKQITVIAPQGEIGVAAETFSIPGLVTVNGQTYEIGKRTPALIVVDQQEKVNAPTQPAVAGVEDVLSILSKLNPQQQGMAMAQLMAKFSSLYASTATQNISAAATAAPAPAEKVLSLHKI